MIWSEEKEEKSDFAKKKSVDEADVAPKDRALLSRGPTAPPQCGHRRGTIPRLDGRRRRQVLSRNRRSRCGFDPEKERSRPRGRDQCGCEIPPPPPPPRVPPTRAAAAKIRHAALPRRVHAFSAALGILVSDQVRRRAIPWLLQTLELASARHAVWLDPTTNHEMWAGWCCAATDVKFESAASRRVDPRPCCIH
jgi:hypothetical protein